jgi:protein-disulfide isomerase
MINALWTFLLALQVAAPPAAPPGPDRVGVPVNVVVYSDFQCPFCAQFAGPFRELQKKGVAGARVEVTFKHFPITALHPAASLAHRAAAAAQAQGKFWEMHDLLFANQARATRADLLGYAEALGLDLRRFERDMDSAPVERTIKADTDEGQKLGVSGTPTFLINGRTYVGARTFPQLQALIATAVREGAPSRAAVPAARTSEPVAARSSVDLILYSDFQCPFCAMISGPVRELQKNGAEGTKVNVQFKNFPLAIHPHAQLAHQAGMAAKAQGKFWEMHDLLFANPDRVQRRDLIGYASTLGLDVRRFERDMDSDAVKKAIAADVAEGHAAGVNATPSFSLAGKMYSGTRTLAQLKDLLLLEPRRALALIEVPDKALSKGPADAAVTMELFVDLQSPVTRPALDVVEEVLRRYPGTLRLQFRNFPLVFNPQAALAHEAAMVAAREGRFWEFTARVLEHQDALHEHDLIAVAGRLGLDEAKFAAALRERRLTARVETDVATGQNRGIRGSPTVIVSDKRIDGVPDVDVLASYIDALLSAPGTMGGGGDGASRP